MQDSWASWAAILGSIATLAIALLTYFSIRIARNTLNLMEHREKRLQPSLQIHNLESFVVKDIRSVFRHYLQHRMA